MKNSTIKGSVKNFKPEQYPVSSIYSFFAFARNITTCLLELPLKNLELLLDVPVEKAISNSKLQQIVNPDWPRQLTPIETPFDEISFLAPIFVSGNTNWILDNQTVNISGNAVLLDGARRLDFFLKEKLDVNLRVIALLGLNTDEELQVRKYFERYTQTKERIEFVERFDTSTERVKASNIPTEFEILTDPFGMPTARGYVATLIVHRSGSNVPEHLIVGAGSLTKPLEEIRKERGGSLKGARVEIHKDGDPVDADTFKRALYVVKHLKD